MLSLAYFTVIIFITDSHQPSFSYLLPHARSNIWVILSPWTIVHMGVLMWFWVYVVKDTGMKSHHLGVLMWCDSGLVLLKTQAWKATTCGLDVLWFWAYVVKDTDMKGHHMEVLMWCDLGLMLSKTLAWKATTSGLDVVWFWAYVVKDWHERLPYGGLDMVWF